MKKEQPESSLSKANSARLKARVLVVDDEAHIVQVLSLKLRNAGYEVMTAVDGEEAFEIALKHKPDLIVTDYQMPYMTGLELCRALATNAFTMKIPVLMLTARGYALDPEDLLIGSIRDVISKPFSPRNIVEQIERILNEVRTSTLEGSRDSESRSGNSSTSRSKPEAA